MYIDGINGLIGFDPSDFNPEDFTPPVVILEMKLYAYLFPGIFFEAAISNHE